MSSDKPSAPTVDQKNSYTSDADEKFLYDEGLDLLANFKKLPPDLRKRIADLISAMQTEQAR